MRFVVVIALLLHGASSWADAPRAREHFQKAQVKYNLLKFDEALKLFEQAYEEKSDPVFLFNIAQCQRQLGQSEAAAKSYRAYLMQRPNASNRADVLARIQDMEKATQEKRAAAPPQGVTPPGEAPEPTVTSPAPTETPAAAPVDRPRQGPRALTIVGGVLTGVGGALLVGGLAAGLVAGGQGDSVTGDAMRGAQFDPGKESAGTGAETASYALYAVGAAAAVAGVVVLVLDWRNHKRGARAGLGVHFARRAP